MLPRDLLPQIDKTQIKKFREYCLKQGISSNLMNVPVKRLKPIQKELKRSKVKYFKQLDGNADTSPPCMISEDNYLMDGHHRWAGKLLRDKECSIMCIKFFCPIKKLVELGHTFEGSTVKSVKEIILPKLDQC